LFPSFTVWSYDVPGGYSPFFSAFKHPRRLFSPWRVSPETQIRKNFPGKVSELLRQKTFPGYPPPPFFCENFPFCGMTISLFFPPPVMTSSKCLRLSSPGILLFRGVFFRPPLFLSFLSATPGGVLPGDFVNGGPFPLPIRRMTFSVEGYFPFPLGVLMLFPPFVGEPASPFTRCMFAFPLLVFFHQALILSLP